MLRVLPYTHVQVNNDFRLDKITLELRHLLQHKYVLGG